MTTSNAISNLIREWFDHHVKSHSLLTHRNLKLRDIYKHIIVVNLCVLDSSRRMGQCAFDVIGASVSLRPSCIRWSGSSCASEIARNLPRASKPWTTRQRAGKGMSARPVRCKRSISERRARYGTEYGDRVNNTTKLPTLRSSPRYHRMRFPRIVPHAPTWCHERKLQTRIEAS